MKASERQSGRGTSAMKGGQKLADVVVPLMYSALARLDESQQLEYLSAFLLCVASGGAIVTGPAKCAVVFDECAAALRKNAPVFDAMRPKGIQ